MSLLENNLQINFPLIIDGGLSNVLESYGCDLNHRLWTAKLVDENPDVIIKAHLEYLRSGSQCITTSSYQSSIPGLLEAGYSLDQAKLHILKTVELAQKAIIIYLSEVEMDTKPLIAASIGPYGAYLADGSEYHGNYNVTNEAIHQFHKSRLEILSHSAADILAIETIPSIMETTVLSDLLRDSPKPAWISFSCKDENHLNDGSRIEDSVAMLENHPTIFAIGVNCTHPKYISDLIQTIKSVCSNKKILVYPNSGEVYDAKTKKWLGLSEPLAFAKMSQQWIQLGADIIGGCCRIGPDQIESIASNFSK